MQNYARFGIFGILALIALRVCIGWHFYMEGVNKVRGNDFSSKGFLVGARGPLAKDFQQMIWDYDGKFRLNQEQINIVFENATINATSHFNFTDAQKKDLEKAKANFFGKDKNDRWIGKLNQVYADGSEEIYKYTESEGRLAKMEGSPTWNDVASLRGQQETINTELKSGVQPTLDAIDAIWKQYEIQLNTIATPEQRAALGYFHFDRPGEGLLSTTFVDQAIPIFDMAVGILLMIGLLTPLAAWAAALFLLSVILSQMPGFPGTQPTYFQAVECLALVVLATTDAGRYAGLDFIPWTWWQNRKARKLAAA